MKFKDLIITNCLTGEKELIKDIYLYPANIRDAMIASRIESYMNNRIPISIDFGY